MNIKDINPYTLPNDLNDAADSIRLSFSLTGAKILSSMSDESVVNLWQFGLREVEQLSEHNVEQGNQPINYPHIWLKKHLLSKVYTNWLSQEEDARTLLKALTPLIAKKSNIHVLPSPSSNATSPVAYSMPSIRQSS